MQRLQQHLRSIAAEQPRAVAVEEASGGLSYREFAQRVVRRRDQLAARYPPGSRILLLLSNRSAQPIWSLASSAAGLVPIIADPRGIGPRLDPLLAAFRPKLVVSEPDDERLRAHPTIGRGAEAVAVAEQRTPVSAAAMASDAHAAIVTSGSTGRPKGVLLSDAAWVESAIRLAEVLEVRAGERAVHAASLAHGSGLLFTAILLAGGTNVLLPRYAAADFPAALAASDASVTFLVPTMLYDLLERPDFVPELLPRLRTLYYSGGPASPSLVLRAANRWGPVLVQDYGLIEAPAPQLVLGRSEHERLARDPLTALAQSCGRPLRPAELSIDRPTDDEAAGVIRLSGPTLMTGYLDPHGVDTSAIVNGVLNTGDLAVQGAEGYVTIVGRTSNVIATGGRKVGAEHVERILRECPGVLDVAVVGLPDERWGEMLTAVVVSRSAGSPPAIAAYAADHLAPHERPKEIFFVTELPVGPTGKLRRAELTSIVQSLRGAAVSIQ